MSSDTADAPVPSGDGDDDGEVPTRRQRADERADRRRRRRARRRGPRPVTIAALVLLTAVAVVGGMLAVDAAAAGRELRAAAGSTITARQALARGEQAQAEAAISRAVLRAREARTHTDGPLWSLAVRTPVLGDSARTVVALADLATTGATVAQEAVLRAGPLLRGELELFSAPGTVDLTLVEDVRATVAALDLPDLTRDIEAVRAVPTRHLPAVLREARDEALAIADETTASLDTATHALAMLPSFLGRDGPRSYLVGVQTNAELRGTGGLMTYLSSVTADAGRLDVTPARYHSSILGSRDEAGPGEFDEGPRPEEDDDEEDDDELTPVPPPPVVSASPGFADRYDHLSGRADVYATNLDPDLPTVAPVLMDVVTARTGRTFDGLVLVDPIGLAEVLAGGPPIAVPPEVSRPPLPNPVPIKDLARVLLVDHYDALSESGDARRAYLDAVATGAIERLLDQDVPLRRLLRNISRATGERHLQVFSRDADEQAFFASVGVTGALPAGDGATDLLAVTGINAAGDKKDAHVSHEMTASFTLSPPRRPTAGDVDAGLGVDVDWAATRSGRLTVALDNPLAPGDHADYVMQSTPPLTDDRDASGPARTWFATFLPAATRVSQPASDDATTTFALGRIHGHRVLDAVVEVPLQDRREFSVDIFGPVAVEARDDGSLVYRLTLWRQAKAIPDLWDVSVDPPAGWQVADASVTGGGPGGTGFGPDPEPERLLARVESDAATFRGAVTRDAVLEVVMVPSG